MIKSPVTFRKEEFENEKFGLISTQITGSIPSGKIAPGDSVPVTVSIINNSTYKVKGFKVKLVEIISCPDQQKCFGNEYTTVAKQKHILDKELKKNKVPKSGEIVVDFLVPKNVQETCYGKIFQRTFQVAFFFKTLNQPIFNI